MPVDVEQEIDILTSRNLTALKGITDEMSKQIMRELSEGILAGESMDTLTQRIMNRVDNIGIVRASAMARTETMFAFNTAAKSRYKDWGVEQVDWLLGGDPCPICDDIAASNPYTMGNVPEIPQHPNCVCTIAPISKYSGG